MLHPWLTFGSPVRRPSFVTQGWANWRGGRADYHRGLDIRAATGDPVYAIGSGVVKYARADYPGSDAGNWIGIEHADQLLSRYIHLSKMYVSVGQKVSHGQLIGLAGSTGASTPHLHFDVVVPATRLAQYVALFGKPASGFGSSDFGVKVPGEPLIPIDRYDSDVIAGMQQQGIPSYGQIVREGGAGVSTVVAVVGLLALGAAGAYYVKTTRPRWF
jgi:murein DD-endopeptidase MepM/ murein hydrolase activator NlpD